MCCESPSKKITVGVRKGTVFFLHGHGRCSFIHSNPKTLRGKKNAAWFFSQEKFIGHSFRFLWHSIFFNKRYLYFFSRNLVCVFCLFFFSRKSSKSHWVIHSFKFLVRKKNKPEINKTAFTFIHSIFLKNAKKRTIPGKWKNTVPLVSVLFLL